MNVDWNVIITNATETEFLASSKSVLTSALEPVFVTFFVHIIIIIINSCDVVAISRESVILFWVLFCFYFLFRLNSSHKEEEVSILQVPDSRAGAGILL